MKNKKTYYLAFLLIILIILPILFSQTTTSTDPREIILGKTKIKKNNNVDYKTDDDTKQNTFNIKNGGAITVDYKGKDTRVYDNFNAGEKTQFIFDEKGTLKEAYFTTVNEKTYKLGDKEFKIPGKTKVVFKDGVAKFLIKQETKPELPKQMSGYDATDDITLEYYTDGDTKLTLPNDEKFKGVLKYDGKYNSFYIDDSAVFGDVAVAYSDRNRNKLKTYLLYDGEEHFEIKASYISMNEQKGKISVGNNVDVFGPAVKLSNTNPYGVKLENTDFFAMRANGNSLGSLIQITNRIPQGKVPLVKTLNQVTFNEGIKSPFYHFGTDQIRISKKGKYFITEFGPPQIATANPSGTRGLAALGPSTTPLQIEMFKTSNTGKIVLASKYGNVIGIGNRNNYGFGKDPRFIRTHVPNYYRQRSAPGLFSGFSNLLTYNYDVTERGFEKMFGVSVQDNTGRFKSPENVRMMMDIFLGTGVKNYNKWGIKRFVTQRWAPWAGLATSGGTFYVAGSGFNPAVIRHEMTHMHDFMQSYRGGFNSEWRAIGGDTAPFTYWYGSVPAEDTSTFGEMLYKNSWSGTSWKHVLSTKYSAYKKFRGRLAIFEKYGFVSKTESDRLFARAGLGTTRADYNRYIQEAKNAYS